MSMRNTARLVLVLALSLFVAGCSDDGKDSPDTDGPKVQADSGPEVTPLVCDNDCADLVMSAITLPDATTATKIGHDYNGDGTVDNALGNILGGLSSMAGGSLNVQEAVDSGINKGTTLVLLRMQADDWATDDSSKAQAWVGAPKQCCSTPDDSAACAAEAKTTCFAGGAEFAPAADSPTDAYFGGMISGSQATYGPAGMKFVLPFTGAGALTLNLKAVYIKGTVGADGKSLSNGILAGAVTQDDLNNNLLPTITTMLNDTLTDPATEQSVKDVIAQLFDTDTSGTVTLEEVKDSTIVKTFLAGDVDVDGDGTKELSLGLGFEAVSAAITNM